MLQFTGVEQFMLSILELNIKSKILIKNVPSINNPSCQQYFLVQLVQ